jgi:hypothetical protein
LAVNFFAIINVLQYILWMLKWAAVSSLDIKMCCNKFSGC